jgi:shikimate kinase
MSNAKPADNGMAPKQPLIFLIGYRGSGKTTVARLLAEHLRWSWCDADAVLEERFGRSIRQIFAEEGEPGFRDKEAAILEELCQTPRQVIATGGGIILREENRAKLKTGLVLWLTAKPECLYERTQKDATTAERRPALAQGGLAEIQEILKKREPLYAECADVTIETDQRSPAEVVKLLLAQPFFSNCTMP